MNKHWSLKDRDCRGDLDNAKSCPECGSYDLDEEDKCNQCRLVVLVRDPHIRVRKCDVTTGHWLHFENGDALRRFADEINRKVNEL